MTNFMKSILSRVLSEEIKNQRVWQKEDIQNGFDGSERDKYIALIKEFMAENDIEIKTI